MLGRLQDTLSVEMTDAQVCEKHWVLDNWDGSLVVARSALRVRQDPWARLMRCLYRPMDPRWWFSGAEFMD